MTLEEALCLKNKLIEQLMTDGENPMNLLRQLANLEKEFPGILD